MGEKAQAVPITVRQLEALVRISESLAKLELSPQIQIRHVQEALRLFKVSTMSAASYNTTNMTEFANDEQKDAVERAESFLKNRLPLHSKVRLPSSPTRMARPSLLSSLPRTLSLLSRTSHLTLHLGATGEYEPHRG